MLPALGVSGHRSDYVAGVDEQASDKHPAAGRVLHYTPPCVVLEWWPPRGQLRMRRSPQFRIGMEVGG
jgi:hypothetical protein